MSEDLQPSFAAEPYTERAGTQLAEDGALTAPEIGSQLDGTDPGTPGVRQRGTAVPTESASGAAPVELKRGTCALCGKRRLVMYRGWCDECVPLRTCAFCGEPPTFDPGSFDNAVVLMGREQRSSGGR